MATVTSLVMPGEERYQINLGGTRAVFEYSRAYGVEHCIFVGRHTFYGAGPRLAALPHGGRAAARAQPLPRAGRPRRRRPLRGDRTVAFPRARNDRPAPLLFARADGPRHARRASSAASTCRWCSGSTRSSSSCTKTTLSKPSRCTIDKRPRGVFNVAGPQPLPLSRIVLEAGRTPVPLPEFVLARSHRTLRLSAAAAGALTHIKYPVVVDGEGVPRRDRVRHATTRSRRSRAFARRFRGRNRARLQPHQLRDVVAQGLGRAAANAEEAMVPPGAGDVILLDVAPAAVKLQALVGDLAPTSPTKTLTSRSASPSRATTSSFLTYLSSL